MRTLYVAFKGKGNSSNRIVRNFSGDKLFLAKYLCNEAYWYMLNKYDNRVVFFHVPSIKYITEEYIEKIKNAISI